MGLMKQFLMEQTTELAAKLGVEEELFYTDLRLIQVAQAYATYKLLQETDTRGEIKKAILTRTDEVVELIQGLLACLFCTHSIHTSCKYSFLCENSTEYKERR